MSVAVAEVLPDIVLPYTCANEGFGFVLWHIYQSLMITSSGLGNAIEYTHEEEEMSSLFKLWRKFECAIIAWDEGYH